MGEIEIASGKEKARKQAGELLDKAHILMRDAQDILEVAGLDEESGQIENAIERIADIL